jgi:hypothetical protein
VSSNNIFLFFPEFGQRYVKIDAYTPFVHLPAEEWNCVPNKKFKSKDFPAD